jgi:Apea-like HEPN
LQRPEREISRSDLWTLFPELSPDFGVIANAWFSKSVDFGPGFHLYLGNRRGVQLYVEHRFASLVWGLEAFHRTSDQTRNTTLTAKIGRILSAVDKRDRRWLKSILEYADEPSLAQRIFSALSPLPLGFDEDELRRFAKKCADERNILSHFGGRRPGDDYAEHLRTWTLLIYAIDYLYHARLLQELGFTEASLRKIFWNIYPSARIRDMLARNGLNISDRNPKTGSGEM